MKPLVRDTLKGLGEYHLKQYHHRIKLNQNENPYELPSEVKEEILRRFAEVPWSRYPAFIPQAQIDQVARFAGWVPEGTLLGNGSNDLLQVIFAAVLEAGRTVVLSQPTFTLYKILGTASGATVVDVPMLPGFLFDVDRLIEAVQSSDASMVVICSPNNPTGTQLSEAEVVRILDSTEALVVLDEAYVQFAPFSCVRLLQRYDRLVVLQTFSKALGAASFRFGYALMSPHLARQFNKIKLPYSVNTFTLTAAEVLISHWQQIRSWIDTLVAEREREYAQLAGIKEIEVYPSAANFLLFESLRKPPGEIFQSVLQKGILIRDVSSYPLLGRGLRVSIGTPEENNEFFNALREAL
jgi:histidinol-phosphate aminotransferase